MIHVAAASKCEEGNNVVQTNSNEDEIPETSETIPLKQSKLELPNVAGSAKSVDRSSMVSKQGKFAILNQRSPQIILKQQKVSKEYHHNLNQDLAGLMTEDDKNLNKSPYKRHIVDKKPRTFFHDAAGRDTLKSS